MLFSFFHQAKSCNRPKPSHRIRRGTRLSYYLALQNNLAVHQYDATVACTKWSWKHLCKTCCKWKHFSFNAWSPSAFIHRELHAKATDVGRVLREGMRTTLSCFCSLNQNWARAVLCDSHWEQTPSHITSSGFWNEPDLWFWNFVELSGWKWTAVRAQALE